jgi:DNA-directed RNA polymerase specialized sigma24 family protein
MPRRSSKSLQRPFPWRETLLAALRQDPRMNLACKTAHISRNTAYQHLRKDARFRRQWENARTQGEDVAYRLHLKQLATDPQYLRTLERFRLAYGSEGKPFLMLKNLVR